MYSIYQLNSWLSSGRGLPIAAEANWPVGSIAASAAGPEPSPGGVEVAAGRSARA
jgi:hypothetical protein